MLLDDSNDLEGLKSNKKFDVIPLINIIPSVEKINTSLDYYNKRYNYINQKLRDWERFK